MDNAPAIGLRFQAALIPAQISIMRGRLTAIHDFNGNSVQILWNQTSGVVTQVVDSANGIYNFNYQGNLLTNVTFGSWLVNFSYDATNRLVSKSITNTAGLYGSVASTWQFQYGTNGLLARIIDPRGNTNTFVQYDQYGRQTNQVDALGRATATRYEIPGDLQITRIDPGTNSWVETYDRKGQSARPARSGGQHHELHLRRFRQPHFRHRTARLGDVVRIRWSRQRDCQNERAGRNHHLDF